MRKLIFVLSLIYISLLANSRTVVNVIMPGSSGLYATLSTYDDYINMQFKTLDSTLANKQGRFTFVANIDKPTMVFLQIRFIKFKFFIEPDKEYNIKTEEINFDNPELYPKEVIGYLTPQFEFVGADSNDVNLRVIEFNTRYSEFIDTNYIYLLRGQDSGKRVKEFEKVAKRIKEREKNEFFSEFVDFEFIKLNLLARNINQKYLMKHVFNTENIQLDNYNYMLYFKEYWNNYLFKTRAFLLSDLSSVINSEKSYNALYRFVQKDSLLRDSILAELVILENIPALYISRGINKIAVLDILTDISANGQNKDIRKIASRMQHNITKLNSKNKAPYFKLYGLDGELYDIDYYKDSYLYLMVWNTQCMDCFSELRLLKELNKDYDDIMHMVVVSIDATPNLARKFKNKYEYDDIQFLYYNLNFVYDYSLDILPHAILIDKEGKIISKDAPLPTEGFSEFFMDYLNKKNNNLEQDN